MKKKVFVLTSVALFVTLNLPLISPVFGVSVIEDSWKMVATLPAGAESGNAIALNGKIYFFGGVYERYDPQTNTWAPITPPPIYNGWNIVACQNKIYYIGPDTSIPTQVYDPSVDKWENKTAQTPRLPHLMRAIAVDNKIYVIGGGDPTLGYITAYNENYVYDTVSDSWSTMASLPVAVYFYASAVLDDKIYVIGGVPSGGGPNHGLNLVQIFDSKLNKWTNGSAIPTAVLSAGACATSGVSAPKRIYVVGGALIISWQGYVYYSDDGRTAINQTQVFNPATGEWSFAASLPEECKALSLVNIGDKLYAVGGLSSTEYKKVMTAIYEYAPIGYHTNTSPATSSRTTATMLVPSSSLIQDSEDNKFTWVILVIVSASIVVIVIVTSACLLKFQKKLQAITKKTSSAQK